MIEKFKLEMRKEKEIKDNEVVSIKVEGRLYRGFRLEPDEYMLAGELPQNFTDDDSDMAEIGQIFLKRYFGKAVGTTVPEENPWECSILPSYTEEQTFYKAMNDRRVHYRISYAMMELMSGSDTDTATLNIGLQCAIDRVKYDIEDELTLASEENLIELYERNYGIDKCIKEEFKTIAREVVDDE